MVWRKAAVLAVAVCLLAIPSAWADGMDLARQGLTAQRSGSFEEAIRLYDQAVAQGDLVPPDLAVVLTNRGDSWRSLGDVTKAVADYRKAIETDPEIYAGYNSLAWVRATSPKDELRNGEEALKLAQKAVELCDPLLLPACLDTLAAAYAETGNFKEAVNQQNKAISLLKKQGAIKVVEELKVRLKSYKKNTPWRDNNK